MSSVLIIEDNRALAHFYKTVIELEGCCSVTVAASAEEALRLLKDTLRPALILVDYYMPSMTGTMFVDALEKQSPDVLRTVSIVGLSGADANDPNIEGFRARVSDCVQKTSDIDAIQSLVRRFLRCPPAAAQAQAS